ncbi:hypothetical protein BDV93DRAFT_527188 [Ceratobasidium sp. AG-I]|nr:hypothetical protein BDV93DRAFT_527188 [Ceratobasidium sp. AG-I]
MPPKRSNPSTSAKDDPPAKKAATAKSTITKTTTKKAGTQKAGTRLKKSATPNWEENPEWSQESPRGEWGKKCVERWCLLPPYDTSIEEEQWRIYYRERSALDKVNSLGAIESEVIECEVLDKDTWRVLRRAAENVAAAIMGSSLDDSERKKRIAYTLMGSLYFTSLEGSSECDCSTREVNIKTRLYSPFGIGTSIDSYYSYHYRVRLFGVERLTTLSMKSKTIDECNAEKPRVCSAYQIIHGFLEDGAPGAVTVFDRFGDGSKGTTAANLRRFEKPLFGCEGWLSPRKLTDLLFAAATVLHYDEPDDETAKTALERFRFFRGESDGQDALAPELARLARLEKDEPAMPNVDEIPDDGVEICVPQRMLLLARQAEDPDD